VDALFEVERVLRVVHEDAVPSHVERVTALRPQPAPASGESGSPSSLEASGGQTGMRRKRVR
jgi:hypothetical protein